jgi:DNA-binding beta-propeller fold protein YncE
MKISRWLSVLLLFLASSVTDAGSATWNLNPTTGDWNTAGNWTPATVRTVAQQLDVPSVAIQSFPVGTAPIDVTSDGTNIWVTNAGDDTVTKLRASDGTLLGTFSAGVTRTESFSTVQTSGQ